MRSLCKRDENRGRLGGFQLTIQNLCQGSFKNFCYTQMASVIIASPTPFPYSSDKAVPWGYDTNVYVHGVKQDTLTEEAMNFTTPTVDNIVGTKWKHLFTRNFSKCCY